MTEALLSSQVTFPSPETVIEYADRSSIKSWEKNLSPVLKRANEAASRQGNKDPQIIDPEQPLVVQDGLYLFPDFSDIRLNRVGQKRGEQDWFLRGGSAHNVTFGVAEIWTNNGQGLKVMRVAVKSFTKPEKALKEAVNTKQVLNRGFRTVYPIGVIADGELGFLITKARSDVQSLDKELWNQYHTGRQEVRDYFESLLYKTAIVLADYHARGIRHSDTQMKNFWVTPRGNVEGIDWEASTIYPPNPTKDQFVVAAFDDLVTLFTSLSGENQDFDIEVLVGNRKMRWLQFCDLIFKPYKARAFDNLLRNGNIEDSELEELFVDQDLFNGTSFLEKSIKDILRIE